MGRPAKPTMMKDKIATTLRALAKVVSDDAARHIIQRVQVRNDGARVRFDATNGHALVSVWINVDDSMQSIPDGLYLPKELADRLVLGVEAGAPWTDGVFPNVDAAIPRKANGDEDGKRLFGVNPVLLGDVLDVVTRVMKAHGASTPFGVEVSAPKDRLDAMRVDARIDGVVEVVCVVMPMRL